MTKELIVAAREALKTFDVDPTAASMEMAVAMNGLEIVLDGMAGKQAVADEMLAALKALVAELDSDRPNLVRPITDARVAIAKAEAEAAIGR